MDGRADLAEPLLARPLSEDSPDEEDFDLPVDDVKPPRPPRGGASSAGELSGGGAGRAATRRALARASPLSPAARSLTSDSDDALLLRDVVGGGGGSTDDGGDAAQRRSSGAAARGSRRGVWRSGGSAGVSAGTSGDSDSSGVARSSSRRWRRVRQAVLTSGSPHSRGSAVSPLLNGGAVVQEGPGNSAPLPRAGSRRGARAHPAVRSASDDKAGRASPSSPATRSPASRSPSSRRARRSPARAPYVPKSRDYLYTKVRYYSTLTRMNSTVSPGGKGQLLDLGAPAHVLPPELFGLSVEEGVSQTSWQTITSIVNTMMGSSIVAMPCAVAQAGLTAGTLCIALMGTLCCLTCLLVVQHGSKFSDFADFAGNFLGRRAKAVTWLFSVLVIVGASMAYHILMAQSLFQLVRAAANAAGAADTSRWWNVKDAALCILVLYPVTNLKDMGLLVKFNSAGFIFLWYTILFIIYHGVHAMATRNFTFSFWPGAVVSNATDATSSGSGVPVDPAPINITTGADWGITTLFGIMMLSYFIHNCIQPILRHADPKTRKRDVVLAYTVACVLYLIVGVVGYFGFADTGLPSVIAENFLNKFASTDLYASSARLSLMLQLMTVYPLLLLIVRTQVLGTIYNSVYPGAPQVFALNALVMAATTLVAMYFGKVTAVLSYTGSIAGLIIVFSVPIAVDVVRRKDTSQLTCRWVAIHCFAMAVAIGVFVTQFAPLPTPKHPVSG